MKKIRLDRHNEIVEDNFWSGVLIGASIALLFVFVTLEIISIYLK